jgi:hypothetical protein
MTKRSCGARLALSARVAGAAIVALNICGFVTSVNAQHATVPENVDPILRITPLEVQRIRPEPTPELRIPSLPGTQTIVLQEYVPTLPASQRIAPVVLHIPDVFFAKTTSQAAEVWGMNLQVQYPSMAPLGRLGVRTSWFGDELLLHLEINRRPSAEARVEMLRRIMAEEANRDSHLALYAPRDAPSEYSEAYTIIYPKLPPSREEWDFIETEFDGRIASFTTCVPKLPNPSCSLFTRIDKNSTIDMQLTFNMKFWDDRKTVVDSVKALVGSFRPTAVQ